MPTFDPNNPKSADAATLYHLRDLLAELAPFQELTEAANKTAALAKIVYGPHAAPSGLNEYTGAEMEALFAEAHLHPPFPSDSAVILDEASPTAIGGGLVELELRRHARATETVDSAARSNLWLWFYDCVAAIADDLVEAYATRACPRVVRVEKTIPAAWGSYEQRAGQDDFLFAHLKIYWGDLDLE